MNLSTIKAITIPDGSVKQITDSQGNLVWAEPSLYPYERLLYLEGTLITYGFDTGVKPGYNSYMIIDFDYVGETALSQQGRGAISSNQRFAIGATNTEDPHFFFGYGKSWNTSAIPYTSGIHRLGVQGHTCNVLNGKVGTSKQQQGDLIDNTFTATSNQYWTANTTLRSVFLFASRAEVDDSLAGQGSGITGRFYYAELGYNDYNHGGVQGVNARFYPARRRSDGQLGIIKINENGTFSFLTPRTGETGTYTAGPSLNSYWDVSQYLYYYNIGGSGSPVSTEGHGTESMDVTTNVITNITNATGVMITCDIEIEPNGSSDGYNKVEINGTTVEQTVNETLTYHLEKVHIPFDNQDQILVHLESLYSSEIQSSDNNDIYIKYQPNAGAGRIQVNYSRVNESASPSCGDCTISNLMMWIY